MNRVAITQRVDVIPDYNERRDALDQAWVKFLHDCDILPILLPNDPESALDITSSLDVSGVLLTGGNDLVAYGGNAPERDETENRLIDWARENDFPILGVCRGMQVIQHRFKVPLVKIDNHVGQRHALELGTQRRVVNSFHAYGATDTNKNLVISAKSEDGVVEAVTHTSEKIYGIMWHPEREDTFTPEDIQMFRSIFGASA